MSGEENAPAPVPEPGFRGLAAAGRWDEYADRLADEGIGWWFDMDVPTIERHMKPLLDHRSAGLSPRLLLLQGTFAPLPINADPKSTLRDITILYRLFQASRDAEGTAAACCLAIASIWDFGSAFSRSRPWLRRMHRLIAGTKISSRARSALQAFVALIRIFHDGRLDDALAVLEEQRKEAEAARCAAMTLYGATMQAIAHAYGGDPEKALLVLEDAAPFRDKASATSHTRLYFEIIRGVVLNAGGRPAEAYRVLLDCEMIFPRKMMRVSMSLLLIGNRLMAASLAGHRDDARLLEANVRNLAVAEHVHFYTSLMHFSVGIAYLRCDRPYKALVHAKEGIAAGERAESFVAKNLNGILSSLALAELNEKDDAAKRLKETLAGCRERGFYLFSDGAAIELARMALDRGDTDMALDIIDAAGQVGPGGREIVSAFRPAEESRTLHERLQNLGTRAGGWMMPGDGKRPIEIRCLGDFSLVVGGRAVFDRRYGSGRTQQLLKLLVSLGGDNVPVPELIDLLWQEVDADRGYASLKTALTRLRRSGAREGADPIRWLHWKNGRVSLARSVVAADALAFEARAEALRGDGAGGGWREAAALYRGDFLPGEDAFGVIESRRNRLRDLHVFVVEGCLAADGEGRDPVDPIECLSQAISVNPTSEKLYLLKVTRLIDNGYRVDAIKCYREAEAVFRDRFGAEPGPELMSLAEKILKTD